MGQDRTVHVNDLADHSVRRDAHHQRGSEVAGQRVVNPRPTAARGAFSGVAHQPGLDQAFDAIGDGGLGQAGPGRELGPGQLAFADQHAQHVLLTQRAEQLQ
jgi:hypothetical protein